MRLLKSLAVTLVFIITSVYADCDYDDGCETESPSCGPDVCRPPNCSCFGAQPALSLADRPQLVMLTFDDAITVANIGTYRNITRRRRNKLGGGRPIALTFFACHEYNDYELTHQLHAEGHEVAVHSISHESNTDLWRSGSAEKWKSEMVGMRTMLKTFGGVPPSEVRGHRAPFLQTAGDTTFEMLHREGFLYDSSMPTKQFSNPPIWPYTLDFGYAPQDCMIQPCPTGTYPGLWEVPMIEYRLESRDGVFHCSMADACTPQPVNSRDTKDYLMSNFLRHYHTNKAPFPVFLHEAWLRNEERLVGYLAFLDEILQKEDVFVVTMSDVIEYMKRPVKYTEFTPRQHEKPAQGCRDAKSCTYSDPVRIMKSCTPCPRYYPWVGTPLGKRKPVFRDPDDEER